MKDRNGPIYFILGLLVVAVLVIGYFVIEGDDDPAPVVVTQTDSGSDDGQVDTTSDTNDSTSDEGGSSFSLDVSEDGVSVSTESKD